MEGLDRQRIIDGLREIVRRAEASGVEGVELRIVGGAALALRYFHRDTTRDIDARFEGSEQLLPLVKEIGEDFGWADGWLNDQAGQFVPFYGKTVDWEHLYESPAVTISIAPPDVLLAMKLNAYEKRTEADADDIEGLIPLTGVSSIEDAEHLVESYFPGDSIGTRTAQFLTRIFAEGAPVARPTPPPPDLG